MSEHSGPSLFNRHQPMIPYMYYPQNLPKDRTSMRGSDTRHQILVPSTHQLATAPGNGWPKTQKSNHPNGNHQNSNSMIGQPSTFGSQVNEDNRNHLGRLSRPRDEQPIRRIGQFNPPTGLSSMGQLNQQYEHQSELGSSRNPINIFGHSPTDNYLNSPRYEIQRNPFPSKNPIQINRTAHSTKSPISLGSHARESRQQPPKNALGFVYGTTNPANFTDLYSDKPPKESRAEQERVNPARQSQTYQKQPLELVNPRRAYTPQRKFNPLCMQLAPFSPSKPEPNKVICGCRRMLNGMCEYADEWLLWVFETPARVQDPSLKERYFQILQKQRNEEDEKQIENDVTRTYPELQVYTKKGPDASKLSNVLNAIAIQNPIIGYVQGINFIVASLMFHIKEEHLTFYVFEHLMDLLDLRELYKKGRLG